MKYTKETYYQYLLKLLPESNFSLDVFFGTEKPCKITCLTCGAHLSFSQAALLARRARRNCKNVCHNCENNDWTKRQQNAKNKALYKLARKQTIQLIGNIKTWSSREPVEWKCLKCNHTFSRSPFVMFAQNSLNCPWCETHPFEYTEEMIKAQAQELWGSEYSVLQVLNIPREKGNKSRRILVCHNKCGFKYFVNQYHFMHGQGCPHCRTSHGEWKIKKYLDTHGFTYQQQYPIKTDSGRTLKLDFYLEEGARKYAIEYNGIQHYQPIEWFDGEEGFKSQQARDKEKIDYCTQHNIDLIIIPFNDDFIIDNNLLAQRLGGQAAE